MKDIREKLVGLLRAGYCTPQISRIARKLSVPAATIHYNVKRLEEDGALRECKAVFDHKKVESGFTSFVLLSLSPDEYDNPEKIAMELSKHEEIESIDICTGNWEIVAKVRVKDQEAYYSFVKSVLSRPGIAKIQSLVSMRELKSEFVSSKR